MKTVTKKSGQLARPETIDLGFAWHFNSEQSASKLAIARGQQDQAAGLGLKAAGGHKGALMLAEVLAY